MKGWNLQQAELAPPAADAGSGVQWLTAGREGFASNRVPFALDTLPEAFDKEANNDPAHAQKVQLPHIINGRIDRPDDWDVFQFQGHADDTIVAEVAARRLDSPLDSVLKLTDAAGKVLAFNDDYEDAGAGTNTHDADSYLMAKLPADGTYYVHIGDTARHGGEEYAYRLRIGPPRPDFALRVVPSSVTLRSKSTGQISVHVSRKDGFTGAIKLGLKDPPPGFSLMPASLTGNQAVTKVTIKADVVETELPVALAIEGVAQIADREVAHVAVGAEDRMQAFLWRHLVPAEELSVLVYNPSAPAPPKRVRSTPAPVVDDTKPSTIPVDPVTGKPKFTKQQVSGRIRQLKVLYEDWLITDEFHDQKVAECEALR
jgi:hypothetical protein